MQTLVQRLAFLTLPLALLVVSACSGHHRSHRDRDAWHDEAYDRGASRDRYDGRGRYSGWGQHNRGGRYDGGDLGAWFRW
jgi:hypothetical protein